jgi:SAM-dependent methyltransferase/uncharacterized protein YbaR (Trm112 family)
VLATQLEVLGLFCPTCRLLGRTPGRLALARIDREERGDVLEGALVCGEPACQREHPIVDGVPIVIADIRSWAPHQLDAVLSRDDLAAETRSMLGDAAGPGTGFDDDRRALSTYCDAHFAAAGPGSFAALVGDALGLLAAPPSGPWLDVGCGPGAGTFQLAIAGASHVLGVDLSFRFVRAAERARRTGTAVWDRRRVGVVYDPVEVDEVVTPEIAERCAFICADATNLPFDDGAFRGALSVNVLDSIGDPVGHATELGRVVAPGGVVALTTPYDWSPAATPFEGWLGGHSQRGPGAGASEPEVRRLFGQAPPDGFDTGLVIGAEIDRVPWRLRVSERSAMEYACHVLRLDRRA